ncbi:TIGR02677 family protein [Heliophilum fasciatum]|uniref:Uncharacterized protein (TIGR02677 family) n=1 Tax=Heliophilum fasciatum TaxID=35700 RepID=A0A4R2RP80_9FIRM|nr:TIGR02677 family protein [Heliophilum fasciatum]MCW2277666.1 uncharacterized protein (TIGR02677 family) [Heliophilum fasciatum]TCP65013.1 uncharacterized protein (TIGR02677 family) [Heliophilum fasciatum]
MNEKNKDALRTESLLRTIPELSYLNATNTPRYRLIMRYFYEQHLRLHYWLKPEEVYAGVCGFELLAQYSLEQCQQDLNALVQWQNLVPRHDGGRSTTIEEYLRKKYRYQMTPYAVEIERMVAGLEKIRGYGGSLEPTLLDNIAANLRRILQQQGEFAAGEGLALWKSTYASFITLTENASDYIASLQSAKAEELMATEAFLIYKNQLTEYLRNFVQNLQRSAFRIEGLLPSLQPAMIERFHQHIVRDLAALPLLEERPTEEEERERLLREWQALVRWFLGEGGENSDIQYLEQASKDTIGKIVRCALRIQEKRLSGVTRRRELAYLGRWFASLDHVDDAHRLAAYTFGLYRTRHFQGHDDKGTESADVTMWQAPPNGYALRSRSRQRRRDGGTDAIANHSRQKAAAREVYLAERQAERELIETFVAQGCVPVGELREVTPFLRNQLLFWISRCMHYRDKTFRTPEGVQITLRGGGGRTRLQCADGALEMPDYTLVFVDERQAKGTT